MEPPSTSLLLLTTFFFFSSLFPRVLVLALGDTNLCVSPLGMEDGRILDAWLTASSYYVHSVGPHQARLNGEGNGGAWCPKEPIAFGVREWIQISMNETHFVSGVEIQGRYAHGKGQEYTEEFEVEYWRDGLPEWRKWRRFDGKSVLPGNSDTSTVVTNRLRPPIIASKIRLLPHSIHRRTVCIRLELLGCPWEGGIVEYEMRQGESFVEGVSLTDDSYDGYGSKWDRSIMSSPSHIEVVDMETGDVVEMSGSSDGGEVESILKGGLGQLTDKIAGRTPFTMDMGFGLGNGWVGWKRSTQSPSDFVEILFTFDTIRKFSLLQLLLNNSPSKGVQFISMAKIAFSIGGIHFRNGLGGIHFVPGPGLDTTIEDARNVSVPLDGGIGRFLRLRLYFHDNWILLSEIYFTSEIFNGNFTEEEGPIGGERILSSDYSDSESPLEIREFESSMVEILVGILGAIVSLLVLFGGFLVWSRRRSFLLGDIRWRNGPWTTVPRHIVTQSNEGNGRTTEGVKDLLITLTPSVPLINGTHLPPTHHYATPQNGSGGQNGDLYRVRPEKIAENKNEYFPCPEVLPKEYGSLGSPPEILHDLHHHYDTNSQDKKDEFYQPQPPPSPSTYSTTKHKKVRVGGCVWNLSWESGGSFGGSLPMRTVPHIPLRQLRLIENLGSCSFGQVHLYDYEGESQTFGGSRLPSSQSRLIAKTLKTSSEMRLLRILDHENVLDLIGVSEMSRSQKLALFPAPECGDLCSFLSRLTSTPSLSWLISVGVQIASGMNYLESLSLIHRDLAARNCLVEREGSIRIGDFAMACQQYDGDYAQTPHGLRPLRWWPWESFCSPKDELSLKGVVWSFGVTLWEILTLCRQKPLAELEDSELEALAKKYGNPSPLSNFQEPWLPQPILSPPEIFDLMTECWQRDPRSRPTFQHIHLFLESKSSTHPPNIYYHAI